MAKGGSTSLLFLVSLTFMTCLSINLFDKWSIHTKYTPSTSSRYYVLNDWQNTYSEETSIAPLPAAKISDIMLKTMGILKDGASWAGVMMGNLFSRPRATALFLVDGISPESSFGSLSATSFKVDQTGLTGCMCGDTRIMFQDDSIAVHLSDLFDHNSQTSSVSANTMAAEVASAQGAYTSNDQLSSVLHGIQNKQLSISKYGLDVAAANLDLTNEVDAHFIAELILVKQTINQLKELKSYVDDASPDVYIFSISTLEKMEQRYGAGSSKMNTATQLVKQVIQESSKALVELYDGQILVQALVLEWNHPALDKKDPELERTFYVLQPFLTQGTLDGFLASLPEVTVKEEFARDFFLCSKLQTILNKDKYYASCPLEHEENDRVLRAAKMQNRRRRSADMEEEEAFGGTLSNITSSNIPLAESRSSIFSAMFLITLFVTVSVGLALFAVSWFLWHNIDPERDSIIYRQVSDVTVPMQ